MTLASAVAEQKMGGAGARRACKPEAQLLKSRTWSSPQTQRHDVAPEAVLWINPTALE
jgi:hypothetical protein